MTEGPTPTCSSCGARLAADQRYCLNCGTAVDSSLPIVRLALVPPGSPPGRRGAGPAGVAGRADGRGAATGRPEAVVAAGRSRRCGTRGLPGAGDPVRSARLAGRADARRSVDRARRAGPDRRRPTVRDLGGGARRCRGTAGGFVWRWGRVRRQHGQHRQHRQHGQHGQHGQHWEYGQHREHGEYRQHRLDDDHVHDQHDEHGSRAGQAAPDQARVADRALRPVRAGAVREDLDGALPEFDARPPGHAAQQLLRDQPRRARRRDRAALRSGADAGATARLSDLRERHPRHS